jgi:1-acyl-sn-glycerol-3-phosphate acyltransferase
MRLALKALALATATGACFFFFWLSSFVLSWVIIPLALIPLRGRSSIERERRSQEIVGRGFRLFLATMRTVRVLVFRPRNVRLDLPQGPFVMIANHPTLIDVTAVMAVCPRICCVAKSELFRSVLVGPVLRYSGHIEGGAVGSMEGASVMQQALRKLGDGQSVLIFPEGTRSPAHGLNRFKSGVFEIALRAGVPIVPILISCEPPTLMKGLQWYALPKKTARYNIMQLPTWPAPDREVGSRQLAEQFQAMFRERIDACEVRVPRSAGVVSDSASAAWASRSPRV